MKEKFKLCRNALYVVPTISPCVRAYDVSAVYKAIGSDFTLVSLGEHQVEDYVDQEPKPFYGIRRD